MKWEPVECKTCGALYNSANQIHSCKDHLKSQYEKIDEWKDKYFEILVKYKELLREYSK